MRRYSLSNETAEKIRSLLPEVLPRRQARLNTPKDVKLQLQDDVDYTNYKGLVILSTGPVVGKATLESFIKFFLKSGFAVLTVVHTISNFALCTASSRKINKIFDVLSSTLDSSCPIVLKLYCGGGYSYLPPIIKYLSHPGHNLNVAGVVLDSSPPYVDWRNMLVVSKYFNNIGKYPTPLHRLRELVMPLLSTTLNAHNKRRYLEQVMCSSSSLLVTIPQLYIYSLSDLTIDISYINDIIDKQRKYGADVTVHTFPDTLHMLHRLKYPEEYDNVLFQFLQTKCNLPI